MSEQAASRAAETDEHGTAHLEATCGEYVGRWNRLVSTTNWEKGRIINEWRTALEDDGAAAQEYSDEAWSRRVGGVSSQHVGRLRRVAQRFGEVREQYEGLYWSHFLAALDWPDAEMWLEGAVGNGWSVSQTRLQRWEAVGAPASQRPRDEDVIATELDEDATAALFAGTLREGEQDAPFVVDDTSTTVHPTDQSGDSPAAPLRRSDRSDNEVVNGLLEADSSDTDFAPPPHGAPTPQPYRAFEQLGELPEDLFDALETFKLAILRHKMAGWSDVSADDVLDVLDALRQLVLAPSE
ncbi:MAG: hypothetical protein R3C10_05500 [Pirellulales bacterium]|nr:hypothetical protein [Planctomycetales bacterium]